MGTHVNYTQSLSSSQVQNMNSMIDVLIENGVTNPFSISAILSVISKESGFKLSAENLNYKTAERINKVFGIPLNEANKYVGNPEKLANYVYCCGKKGLGNGAESTGDGYKYRGRPYIGITGRSAYKKYGDIMGVDLIGNPDLLLQPKYASLSTYYYYKSAFGNSSFKLKLKEHYNNDGSLNGFKSLNDAIGAFYHATDGVNKAYSDVLKDSTGGRKKAFDKGVDFLNYVNSYIDSSKKKI